MTNPKLGTALVPQENTRMMTGPPQEEGEDAPGIVAEAAEAAGEAAATETVTTQDPVPVRRSSKGAPKIWAPTCSSFTQKAEIGNSLNVPRTQSNIMSVLI